AAVASAGRPRPSDDGHLDRGDPRQVAGDLVPALAFVHARVDLPGARPEVEAGRVLAVDRHSAAQDSEVRILLWQALGELLPARAGVPCPPDRSLPVGHRAPAPGIERDGVEGVLVVRVDGGGEAELARQPVADLRPRLRAVVAAVHADMVLL